MAVLTQRKIQAINFAIASTISQNFNPEYCQEYCQVLVDQRKVNIIATEYDADRDRDRNEQTEQQVRGEFDMRTQLQNRRTAMQAQEQKAQESRSDDDQKSAVHDDHAAEIDIETSDDTSDTNGVHDMVSDYDHISYPVPIPQRIERLLPSGSVLTAADVEQKEQSESQSENHNWQEHGHQEFKQWCDTSVEFKQWCDTTGKKHFHDDEKECVLCFEKYSQNRPPIRPFYCGHKVCSICSPSWPNSCQICRETRKVLNPLRLQDQQELRERHAERQRIRDQQHSRPFIYLWSVLIGFLTGFQIILSLYQLWSGITLTDWSCCEWFLFAIFLVIQMVVTITASIALFVDYLRDQSNAWNRFQGEIPEVQRIGVPACTMGISIIPGQIVQIYLWTVKSKENDGQFLNWQFCIQMAVLVFFWFLTYMKTDMIESISRYFYFSNYTMEEIELNPVPEEAN